MVRGYMTRTAENQEILCLRQSLEAVLEGLGFSLIELTVSRHRGSARVKAVIYNGASIGTDDCSRAHRAILPRLELEFKDSDVYLEVSSPGIDRLIKDRFEFERYVGRTVRCYRTDITEWTTGVLESVDKEEGIVLMTEKGKAMLEFEVIAKARLC